MNDPFDQMVVATRERLRREAEQAVNSDAMLREILDGSPRVQPLRDSSEHDRRTRFLAVAALILVVVGGLVALRRDNDRVAAPKPSSTVTPAPTATVAPSTSTVPTTVPATTVVPSTVVDSTGVSTTTPVNALATLSGRVVDMSWVDAQHGWALLGDSQSSTSALYATSDGGRTWQSSTVDTQQAAHVKFADLTNGWMFSDGFGDGSTFESTHDGGVTWHSIDLTPAGMVSGPQALATTGQTVSIVAGVAAPDQNVSWTVATSPVGVDQFARIGIDFQQGAGPANAFSLATSGGNIWSVYNDRTVVGVGRSINGAPTAWTPPWTDLVGPATVTAAKAGGPLYAVVTAGLWGGPTVEDRLYVSDDNGDTFRQVTLPTGAAPAPSTTIHAVDATTLVVALTEPDGSLELCLSHDEGSTWQQLSKIAAQGGVQIVFADSTTAYSTTFTSDGEHSQVMKSTDGGATWQPIVIA